ncbi:beta-lactamase/transpeptidase-like protein [Boeremia exigua]|uniref:beta-lactamase/transpeptidase-like protein n=1 Tax=Boeremia exigua TaxID=749465 RepID=UPI001E8ED2AC|nr:beta-lactamase/transpeptidase-like protein [Boeremia exigua]KAH6615400.1 beta-lactamase/transpeptidase-like protein [Boeremia exigua]
MENFEEFLKQSTVRGANKVPGAIMAVVDKDGNYIYKNASGYSGVGADAEPLSFDSTLFVASCTKVITTIASLQLVERGIVGLDDPLDDYLPELASQPIVTQNDDGDFVYHTPTQSVTLRHLITHSSGAAQDWMTPVLKAWRHSRGEVPVMLTDGDVAKGCAYPRTSEAGSSWMYTSGLDWASLLVERLTDTGFEEYVEKHIIQPLSISSFTWHLSHKPDVAKKLMRMTTRQDDGTLTNSTTPIWPDPVKEGGGSGMYSNVHDFTRVLADLLKDSPTLLKRCSVQEMFTAQFVPGSSSHKALISLAPFSYQCSVGGSMDGVDANQGLSGLLVTNDVDRDDFFRPKATLAWTGLPNLLWSINRERGLALFIATQVMPWGDSKTWELNKRFETAVWRTMSKVCKE